MTIETINCADNITSVVLRNGQESENVTLSGKYTFECVDAMGNIKWTDTINNLVTTVGKNSILDVYLGASTQITTWYVGLISSDSYSAVSAADTSASHAGWKEASSSFAPNYSEATRVSAAWSAAASGSKATSAASAFTLSESGTVKGAFLISISTKGGTTGTLYSAGVFTAGDKVVQSGDIINVTYTATAS